MARVAFAKLSRHFAAGVIAAKDFENMLTCGVFPSFSLSTEVRTTHVTGCITDIGSTAGRAAILLVRRFCHKEGSGLPWEHGIKHGVGHGDRMEAIPG